MKLLVCDDDISTIAAIKSQLDLEALGITSFLEAYHGEAAIAIIQKERPELVLCDIGMPKVNGIEVLRFVFEQKIPTEFVFLTCYEDFKYAQEALRYGAKNYLTKPVDFDELRDCLAEMISSWRERQKSQDQSVDQNYADSKRNHALRQIHDGFCGTDRERIDRLLQKNGLSPLRAETLVRVIFMIADSTQALHNGWDKEMLTYSYSRLAEEILTDYVGLVSTISHPGDRYVYTFTYLEAEKYAEEDCFRRCREFTRFVSANYPMLPVCIITDPFPLYEAAEQAELLRTEAKKVILQAGSIYLLRDVEQITEASVSLIDEAQILRLVKQRDKAGFLGVVTSAVHKIVHGKKNNATMMATLHQGILQAFYNCFKDNDIPVFLLLQDEHLRLLDQKASRSPADILSFSGYLFDFTMAELQRKSDETDMMGQVKRYIAEHYKTDINRNDVAAVAYITPNYLSKRFRAETGMTLREYINQLRIEEAKRLLLSTNANISEVASEVGYDNISYFSTVFRKLCGMSPVEWCAGKRGKEEQP